MPPDRPTIRTIAERAGVSPMTVSRALRGDRHVDEETRERIRALAQQLDYQPNPSAIHLRARRGRKAMEFREYVALLIAKKDPAWLQSWKHKSFIHGVQTRAGQFGYKLVPVWLYEPGWSASRVRNLLRSSNIHGTVLFPDNYRELPEEVLKLVARQSCAVLGGQPMNAPFHFAAIDDFASAKAATRKALSYQYRRPGFVVLRWIDELIDRRYSAGFRSVQQDLPSENHVPVLLLNSFSEREFSSWYAEHQPDVVITHNRRIAVDEWLLPLGRSVPRDVGWITLDVVPGDEQVSGIDARSELVGVAALDLVLDQMQRDEHGIPAFQKGVFIEGIWQDGRTLREMPRPAGTKVRAAS